MNEIKKFELEVNERVGGYEFNNSLKFSLYNLTLYFKNNYPYSSNKKPSKKYIATLGIGGNIGNVIKTFNILFTMLKSNSKIIVLKTSPILKNPPFGFLEQNYFYNAIIQIQTNLSPYELLKMCWYYENKFK